MVNKLRIIAVIIAAATLIGAWPNSGLYVGSNQYFWSTSGSDSNNCLTPATACQTISHFNSFSFRTNLPITVSFNGGNTFSGGLVLPDSNMTINSYGSGQATISSGNSTPCITATNLAHTVINNIVCTGGGNTSSTTDGVVFTNSQAGNTTLNGITVTNTTISGYGGNGIYVVGTNGDSGFSNIVMTGNTVHDVTGKVTALAYNGLSCIQIATSTAQTTTSVFSNLTLSNNTLYNCTGNANTTAVFNGGGITVGEANNVLMSFNLVHNFGSDNTVCGGPVGLLAYNSTTVNIEFNEVYDGSKGSGGGCDGGGADLDGNTTNSFIQYNYFHDFNNTDWVIMVCGCTNSGLQGSFAPFNENNTVRFNVVYGTGSTTPLRLLGNEQTMTNAMAYNNTVYGANGQAIYVQDLGSHLATAQVYNNIIETNNSTNLNVDVASSSLADVTIAGNLYYNTSGAGTVSITYDGTTYTSLSSFQSGTSQEMVGASPVGIQGTPGLQNDGTDPTCGGYLPPCPSGYHPAPHVPYTVLEAAGFGTWMYYIASATQTNLPVQILPFSDSNGIMGDAIKALGPGNTLALDGSANSICTSGTTCTLSLSTTQSNDVIVCQMFQNNGESTISDGNSLTWTKRAHLNALGNSGHQWMEYWTAVSASPLSSDTITFSNPNSNRYGNECFGISGANTSTIFDSNVSLPATSTTVPIELNTSNADDFIMGFQTGNTQANSTINSPVLPPAGLNLTTDFSINPGTQDFYGNAVSAATLPVGAAAQ